MFDSFYIYFIDDIYLKRMGLDLPADLSMFVYTFQSMLFHMPLEVQFLLEFALLILPLFSPYALDISD